MRIFKTLKLGIIGHGFVGKATDWGFNKRVEKFIVDPLYSTNIDDLSKFDPKLTFICVPTPMDNDGTQDSSIIESAVEEVTKKCPKSIIVIKSTVLPSVLENAGAKDTDMIIAVTKNDETNMIVCQIASSLFNI